MSDCDDFDRLAAIVQADDELAGELMAEVEIAAFVRSLILLAERHGLNVSEGRIHLAIEEGRHLWYSTWSP